jgi:predicted transcriptional regulator
MIIDNQRNLLIDKIKSVNDQQVLDEVSRLLQTAFTDKVYSTTAEQKSAISKGIEQIERGEFKNSEVVFENLHKWLEQ